MLLSDRDRVLNTHFDGTRIDYTGVCSRSDVTFREAMERVR